MEKLCKELNQFEIHIERNIFENILGLREPNYWLLHSMKYCGGVRTWNFQDIE